MKAHEDVKNPQTEEQIVVEQQWNLTYRHSAGPVNSHFFVQLRDAGQLVGRFCPSCKRVLMPPRSFCDRCFVETTEWRTVGPGGRLEMFTTVFRKFQGLPDPPYCFGYVLLDGADTAILNYIRGVDLSDRAALERLSVGTRMHVALAEQRKGRIGDFWFEPE